MHGCGNDYVYVDCTQQEMSGPEAVAKYVSRYHYGIGSDGLILICPSDVADFKMRMFNADGSEGKMCGNGIRCVAKYVYDHHLTDKNPVSIETLAGIKRIDLTVADGKVTEAKVDMGEPETRPHRHKQKPQATQNVGRCDGNYQIWRRPWRLHASPCRQCIQQNCRSSDRFYNRRLYQRRINFNKLLLSLPHSQASQ